MKNKQFFQSLYFKVFVIYLMGCIVLLFSFRNGEFVLFVNKWSLPILDKSILLITNLGGGTFFIVIAFLLLLYKVRFSINLISTLILVSIFTAIGKRVLFFQHKRPLYEFYYNDFHRFLIEVPLNYHNSFPSGHTMAAFGFLTMFAILIANKKWSMAFLVAAITIGFSRIYLLQHFLLDVFVGSILGVICALLVNYLFENIFKLNRKAWMDLPIHRIVKKRRAI